MAAIKPDWDVLDWKQYTYIPLGTWVAIPNLARGCPFTCSFCSQWKFWRDYRVRDPRDVVDEIQALRLHRWLSLRVPMGCYAIAEEAGARTADYIIAKRIPPAVVWLLRHLPALLAAPVLMAAIRKHAWTFAGAGVFVPRAAWGFTTDRSAAEDIIPLPDSLFHWYAAVFTRLYRCLVAGDCTCRMIDRAEGLRQQLAYRIARGN
ncbi:MAG: hypothetical protein OHK0018_09090 [Erythrobacter tepidarius]